MREILYASRVHLIIALVPILSIQITNLLINFAKKQERIEDTNSYDIFEHSFSPKSNPSHHICYDICALFFAFKNPKDKHQTSQTTPENKNNPLLYFNRVLLQIKSRIFFSEFLVFWWRDWRIKHQVFQVDCCHEQARKQEWKAVREKRRNY